MSSLLLCPGHCDVKKQNTNRSRSLRVLIIRWFLISNAFHQKKGWILGETAAAPGLSHLHASWSQSPKKCWELQQSGELFLEWNSQNPPPLENSPCRKKPIQPDIKNGPKSVYYCLDARNLNKLVHWQKSIDGSGGAAICRKKLRDVDVGATLCILKLFKL